MAVGPIRGKLGRMSVKSTSRTHTRRPRRPGDARHDPAAVDEGALLDDVHDDARHAGASPLPVVCQEVLLLRALADCPVCGRRTPVFAMMGLPEFEVENAPTTLLRRIAALPAEVEHAVRDYGGGAWRRDQSEKARGAHWHSHCRHCAARLGEAFVLGPDGPFRPALYKQRAAIRSMRLQGPFVLKGVQRHESLPMLAWLEWQRQRAARAAAGRPTRR